jgi:hypothetical protein
MDDPHFVKKQKFLQKETGMTKFLSKIGMMIT